MISLGYDEDIEAGGQVVGSGNDEPLQFESLNVDHPDPTEVDIGAEIQRQTDMRATKGRRVPPTVAANPNAHLDRQRVAGVSVGPGPAPLAEVDDNNRLLYDGLQPAPKRSRVDDHDPLDWYKHFDDPIAKELAARKRRQAQTAATFDRMIQQIERIRHGSGDKAKENAEDGGVAASLTECKRRSKIHRTIPADSQWLPLTSADGQRRFYVTQKSAGELKLAACQTQSRTTGQLLGRPFDALLLQVEQNMFQAESATTTTEEAETQPPSSESTVEPVDENVPLQHTENLWVEKYRPHRFIDLLSDDGINRCLLTWLRLWDECVFHRKNAALVRAQEAQLMKQGGGGGAGKLPSHLAMRGGKKFTGRQGAAWSHNDLPLTLDKYKRPEHKIALLCGPPGLGKSTLAHVIASHAGYRVNEMNASDDRQLHKFEDRIEGALASTRTIDGDAKPNCLIIDEIDGAPAPSINYLVSLVKDSITRKKKKRILRRPIICICNDLFAPSLRELRKVALVLQFPDTNALSLVERLKVICRLEQLRFDPVALELLCAKTSQDVRSCVNFLQFTAANTTTAANVNRAARHSAAVDISVHDVSQDAVGQKDAHQSLFQVWRMIFELTHTRTEKGAAATERSRFSRVLAAVQACGEADKLVLGCWQNYLLAAPNDATPALYATASDWFVGWDRLDRLLHKTQSWTLARYVHYVPVVAHLLCAQQKHINIQYPNLTQQLNAAQQQHASTLALMLDEYNTGQGENTERHTAHASVRASYTSEQLLLHVLPLLLHCIRPALKPMNAQLYSAAERSSLARVCDVMLHYNLSYRQQRMPDASYDYLLEPPIEPLVQLADAQHNGGVRLLTYSTKQLIARELELQRVKRLEAALQSRAGPVTNSDRGENNDPERSSVPPKALAGAVAANKPNRRDLTASIFKQLGGKSARSDVAAAELDAARLESASSDALWFKYNDGSSNAIKRNIKMKHLLK